MGRGQRKGFPARGLLAALLPIVVLSGGGCEIAIGSGVGDFECVQGPAVCPGDEVCNPSSHQCVEPCSVTGCSGGSVCDPEQSVCVAVAPGPDGDDSLDASPETSQPGVDADSSSLPETAPPPDTGTAETGPCRGLTCVCSGSSSCDSGICADALTVTAGLFKNAGNNGFCTKPCCTSADCDANSVCFATAAGGNYCVAPSWLQRGQFGASPGGAQCSTGRDCRSGLCSGSSCADVCCSTAGAGEPNQCAPGTSCRFAQFPGSSSVDSTFVAWCGAGGSGGNGDTCNRDQDCQSELCNGTGFDGNCSNACRNSADCGQGMSCAYSSASSGTGTTTGVVALCLSGQGHGAQGSSCSDSSECASEFCDSTSLVCTDVCFADTDCTKSGWRCRPEMLTLQTTGGSFSVLACGP